MTRRALYVLAYDVAKPSRLRKVHRTVKRFATGGQKSVFECLLTPAEREELLAEAGAIIDEDEDRLMLFRVEKRAQAGAARDRGRRRPIRISSMSDRKRAGNRDSRGGRLLREGREQAAATSDGNLANDANRQVLGQDAPN